MSSCPDLIRVARKIHAAYTQAAARQRREQEESWSRLEHHFQLMKRGRQLCDKASSKKWRLAAARKTVHLQALLRGVSDCLGEVLEPALLAQEPLPRLYELVAELQAL